MFFISYHVFSLSLEWLLKSCYEIKCKVYGENHADTLSAKQQWQSVAQR